MTVRRLKWMLTGNWRASTRMTGGGVGKRRVLAVKSSTRSVADMMTSLRGLRGGLAVSLASGLRAS
jgi:hypothetical protein